MRNDRRRYGLWAYRAAHDRGCPSSAEHDADLGEHTPPGTAAGRVPVPRADHRPGGDGPSQVRYDVITDGGKKTRLHMWIFSDPGVVEEETRRIPVVVANQLVVSWRCHRAMSCRGERSPRQSR